MGRVETMLNGRVEMPKRTGLPTLTDERRKWDGKRLFLHYLNSSRPQSAVSSWRKAFPRSTANDNSARAMCGELLRWFQENCLDEELRQELMWGNKPPHWRLPRGRTKREQRTIQRASRIIFAYCVDRLPLEECWKFAEPGSSANPNSARILAQRTANNFIRKYPGAAQVVLETYSRRIAALTLRRSSRK